MDNPTELPDDVRRYLEGHADVGLPNARALLEKYTPQPKTLADYGEVFYTRCYTEDGAIRYESTSKIDGMRGVPWRLDVPWPDDGGVCDLLNAGWRLMRSDELEVGKHEVYWVEEPENPYFAATVQRLIDLDWPYMVLAREFPQEDEA